jgi:hypothetical protein
MDSEIKEILDRWRKLERERAEFEARARYWEKMYWGLYETQVKKKHQLWAVLAACGVLALKSRWRRLTKYALDAKRRKRCILLINPRTTTTNVSSRQWDQPLWRQISR